MSHEQVPDLPENETTEERDMTTQQTATTEPVGAKWKRKAYFDDTSCGLVGCKRAPDGYLCDTKPTGKKTERLWFGPACKKCMLKLGCPVEAITPLKELAYQRNGASDLALVLDIEVGEVLKRLEAAGIDENGSALVADETEEVLPPIPPPSERQAQGDPAPLPATDDWPYRYAEGEEPAAVVPHAPADAIQVAASPPVVIPSQDIAASSAEGLQLLGSLDSFNIVNQQGMDLAAGILADVKGAWKNLDGIRKAIGKPLRDRLQEIQDHFKPALALFETAEKILKDKISEGSRLAAEAQQRALLAAQQAHQAGDAHALAVATQQVSATEVGLPQGVTTRKVARFRIVDAAQLPPEFWTAIPDTNKLQAYVDAGWRGNQIPGVEIWEEDIVSSRAS
jgi:hypothetical protein